MVDTMDRLPDPWSHGSRGTRYHPFNSEDNSAQGLQLPPLSKSSEASSPPAPMIGRSLTHTGSSHSEQHTIHPSHRRTPPRLSRPVSPWHMPNNTPYGAPGRSSGSSMTGPTSDLPHFESINRPVPQPRLDKVHEGADKSAPQWITPGAQPQPQSKFSSRYPSVYKDPSPGLDQTAASPAKAADTISPTMPPPCRWTPPSSSCQAPGRSTIYDLLSAPSDTYHVDTSTNKMKSPENRQPWVAPKLPLGKVRDSTYKIVVRQQPIAARACGNGEKDRRVIDPPPIVQLLIDDPTASKDEVQRRLRQNYTVVCSIWSESGKDEVQLIPDDRTKRRLTGTLVSCPFFGRDDSNMLGTFFCFPDLSVRTQGSYRLRFTMIVMAQETPPTAEMRLPVVAVAKSDVFKVYPPKDFPGMMPSTALMTTLRRQGAFVILRKGGGGRSMKSGKGSDMLGEDDVDDEDEEDQAEDCPLPKRAKMLKKIY